MSRAPQSSAIMYAHAARSDDVRRSRALEAVVDRFLRVQLRCSPVSTQPAPRKTRVGMPSIPSDPVVTAFSATFLRVQRPAFGLAKRPEHASRRTSAGSCLCGARGSDAQNGFVIDRVRSANFVMRFSRRDRQMRARTVERRACIPAALLAEAGRSAITVASASIEQRLVR